MTDLTDLEQLIDRAQATPSQLRPGCHPALRMIVELSGTGAQPGRDIAADDDPHGHAGGNALDVLDPIVLAPFIARVPQLFACVFWADPALPDEAVCVWDGQLTTVDMFTQVAVTTYSRTMHLSSSWRRLQLALREDRTRQLLTAGYTLPAAT